MFLPKGDSYNEVIESYVSDLQRTLSSLNDLISTLVTPVSFLLVFRLGRAAVRFWDARQAAGLMIELCRSNIAIVTVGFISPIRRQRRCTRRQLRNDTKTNDEQRGRNKNDIDEATLLSAKNHQPETDFDTEIELLCEYARWLTSFPVAVKHFLRPDERLGWDDTAYHKKQRFEIGPLLCDEDANRILLSYEDEKGKSVFERNAKRVREPPLVVLNRLHELSYDIAHHDYDQDNKESFNPTPHQRAVFFQQLNNQINILCKSFGTMERIKNTPLPFVYVILLRSNLLLYLFLSNMTSIASVGWAALPALFAYNLLMLGIEAATVECEKPFDWNANHLTLGKFCVVAARNIAQALKEVRY